MLKPIAVTRPYPGLRPFEQHEAEIFFGRDDHVDRLLEILKRERFLAVIGPSGCGKSSLVRAGLLPAVAAGRLGSGTWRLATIRPGEHPIRELARALMREEILGLELKTDAREEATAAVEEELMRGRSGLIEVFRSAASKAKQRDGFELDLLLIVDQFEELFTYARGGDEQADESTAFVNLLLEPRTQRELGIDVVLTMRTDFLGECPRFLDLPDAINRTQYLTPRLNRDEMSEAIVGPAALFGKKIDEQLVGHLINSVGGESDQLPILQHALSRMWEHACSAGVLNMAHLREVGGVAEALSKHATDVYDELPSDRDRQLAEHLFRYITGRTSPEDGSRDVRHPASLRQIAAAKEGTVWNDYVTVVEAFSAEGVNFLTFTLPLDADKKIDISHEALIRKWVLLREWVKDEATRADEYREWRTRAMRHKAGDEPMLAGIALARAIRWWEGNEKTKPTPRWAARYATAFKEIAGTDDAAKEFETTTAFIAASREEDQRERRREEEARLAQATATRMRRALVFVVVCALLATGMAGFAVLQEKRASRAEHQTRFEADEAKRANKKAQSEKKKADDERQRAVNAEQRATEAKNAATAAAGQLAKAWKKAQQNADEAQLNAEVAQARQLVSESEKFQPTDPDQAQVRAVRAYEKKVMPETESRLRAVRLAFANVLGTFGGAPGDPPLTSAAVSRDGSRIVTGTEDGLVRLWDAKTQRKIFEIRTLRDLESAQALRDVESVQFTPHGDAIVTLTGVHVDFWNARSGEKIEALSKLSMLPPAFVPDGRQFAVVGGDGVELFDTTSGKKVRIFSKEGNEILWSVAFSHDGSRMITGSGKTAIVWDVASGKKLATLTGHTDDVECAEFSPDGSWIVTGSDDSTARVWDGSTYKQIGKPLAHPSPEWITKLVFPTTESAPVVGTLTDEGIMRVWVFATEEQDSPTELKGHSGKVVDVAYSRDADLLLTVGDDATARLWNGPDLVTTFTHRGPLVTGGFGAGGTVVMAAGTDGAARLWSVGSNKSALPVRMVDAATFSPDGKLLMTTGTDGVWMFNGLAPIPGTRLTAVKNAAQAAFSRDGRLIVATDTDGTAAIWDKQHLQRPPVIVRWSDDDASPPAFTTPEKSRQPSSTSASLPSPYAAFSPDHAILATAGGRTPRLWRTNDGTLLRALPKLDVQTQFVEFSSDGKTVAFASADGVVHLYDVVGGVGPTLRVVDEKQKNAFKAHEERIGLPTDVHSFAERTALKQPDQTMVAFSPDGRAILAWSTLGSMVRLWHLDGTPLRVFDHGIAVSHAEFSADGDSILTVGGDGIARIWSTLSGLQHAALKGHDVTVSYATFSIDGGVVATTSNDGSVRLWSASTGEQLQVLAPKSKLGLNLFNDQRSLPKRSMTFGRRAQFSPDQKTLLAVTLYSAAIWDVSAATESAREMVLQIKRRVPTELWKEDHESSHLASR